MLSWALGLLVWSLAEYWVHRVVLHKWYPRFHAIHHKDPLNDEADVGYRIAACVCAAVLGLAWVTGFLGFAVGLVTGYLLYVTIHEGMHRWDLYPIAWDNQIRHDIHHARWRYNYGVTSPLWDVVFGTYKR
jgi:sterol desaturase/sphingolipid hydroxylase (fatty acid hydroxylase superfamily)